MERGVVPRAVEDIFNIVKNSEERDEDFEVMREEISRSDMMPEHDYENKSERKGNQGKYKQGGGIYENEEFNHVPERMFLRVSVY